MKTTKKKSFRGIVVSAAMALLAATSVMTMLSGCGVWAHIGFGAG